jgi:hypothetical protein
MLFVNLWCGALGNNLITPHVSMGCLPAAHYRNFLEKELLLNLEDVPLAA